MKTPSGSVACFALGFFALVAMIAVQNVEVFLPVSTIYVVGAFILLELEKMKR
jgi:hypothetical protein